MSKRELGQIATGAAVDVNAPRAKRHRADTASSPTAEDSGEAIDVVKMEDEGQKEASDEQVKEQGLKLWQTVKDAVNKEGRVLSVDFMVLPSKRQYPDYYTLIKRPMDLRTVKKRLDTGQYFSLEDVRQDLEQCFTNAKKYNLKESQIWKDAKALHKVTKKEHAKLTGREEQDADDDGNAHDGEEGENGEKRQKVPNLYRQMKAKIHKLVNKTDENGRVLATEFMELPNRKLWPEYYKMIKNPQCFETVLKRVKRKEYTTSAAFAKEVELIFDNALEFNADHTPIWDDAMTLRRHFAKLMSELPAEFALPQYAPVPKLSKPVKAPMPTSASPSAQPHLTLRLPAVGQGSAGSSTPQPSASTSSALPNIAPANGLPVMANQAGGYPQYYAYQQHTAAVAAPSTPTPQPAMSESPGPSNGGPPSRPIRSVCLTMKPAGRRLTLDQREGVASWVLRLVGQEKSVDISDVAFGSEEDETDEMEVDGVDEEDEEDEDEEDEDEEDEKSRKKKGKGRGRPQKKKKAKENGKLTIKVKTKNGVKVPVKKLPTPVPEDVLVKLNGAEIAANEDVWHAALVTGSNLLEVGEKGGNTWKVYLFA